MSHYHRSAAGQRQSKAARAHVTLPAQCAKCGGIIQPGEPFDMGHVVDVAQGGAASPLLPEHRRCNRRSGGRLGAAVTNRKHTRGAYPSW
ncbi:hypothetical protein [Microbacterium sp. P5_E9]